jgi:hypothetical protein
MCRALDELYRDLLGLPDTVPARPAGSASDDRASDDQASDDQAPDDQARVLRSA